MFKRTLGLFDRWDKGPSINDVGNFSGFLTPPPPGRQFFSTIRRQFWPIFDPSPLPIADVVYGRPHSTNYRCWNLKSTHLIKSKSTLLWLWNKISHFFKWPISCIKRTNNVQCCYNKDDFDKFSAHHYEIKFRI